MRERAEQQYDGRIQQHPFSPRDEQFHASADNASFDDKEALARVVAVDDNRVWLEPMQGGSCGGCASAAACGSKGIGTIANRLEARRFAVAGRFGLRVGEEVVVAYGEGNLVKAAAVAYGLPLLFAVVVAAIVQAQAGRDGLTLLGALAGLALGFVAMKAASSRLEAGGGLEARIVRRVGPATIPIFPTGN